MLSVRWSEQSNTSKKYCGSAENKFTAIGKLIPISNDQPMDKLLIKV